MTDRSHRWSAADKRLMYVTGIVMLVGWFEPWSWPLGAAIQMPAALFAVGMILLLRRSAGSGRAEPLVRRRTSSGFVGAVAWVLIAAIGFGAWWIWMGWDHSYKNGGDPYEAWQVIGSALTVVAAILIAWWWASRRIVVSALAIGYAIGWGASNMPGDESGLSGVGLIMVLIGVGAAAAVLTVVADALEAQFFPQQAA